MAVERKKWEGPTKKRVVGELLDRKFQTDGKRREMSMMRKRRIRWNIIKLSNVVTPAPDLARI